MTDIAKAYLVKHKPKRPKVRYRAVEYFFAGAYLGSYVENKKGQIICSCETHSMAKRIAAALNKCG